MKETENDRQLDTDGEREIETDRQTYVESKKEISVVPPIAFENNILQLVTLIRYFDQTIM